jgi:hypothetical protein
VNQSLLVLAVRGSSEFVARCREVVGDSARFEVVSLRMLPRAVAEWRPALILVPEELHGERAARLRGAGERVVELVNDPSGEAFAKSIREAIAAL